LIFQAKLYRAPDSVAFALTNTRVREEYLHAGTSMHYMANKLRKPTAASYNMPGLLLPGRGCRAFCVRLHRIEAFVLPGAIVGCQPDPVALAAQ